MLGPNHRGRPQTLPIAPDPWMLGQDADGCLFSFCFFLVCPEQMHLSASESQFSCSVVELHYAEVCYGTACTSTPGIQTTCEEAASR